MELKEDNSETSNRTVVILSFQLVLSHSANHPPGRIPTLVMAQKTDLICITKIVYRLSSLESVGLRHIIVFKLNAVCVKTLDSGAPTGTYPSNRTYTQI